MRNLTFTAVLLTACGGQQANAPSTEAGPDAAPVVATPLEACMSAHCPEGSAESCAQDHCAATEPTFRVGAKTIRFDENTLYVELEPAFTAGRVGDIATVRERPIFAGVTAVTPSGKEIDLLVHELQPGPDMSGVVFTAELDDHIDHVLVGLWDRKIAPCDVARSGCEEFGFVLDGSLATYPPNVYETGQRQRLLQEDLTIAVQWSEAPPDNASAIEAQVRGAAMPVADVYGVAVDLHSEAGPVRETTEVRHRHPRDAYVAQRIAGALKSEFGVTARVRHTPDSDVADIVLTGPLTAP